MQRTIDQFRRLGLPLREPTSDHQLEVLAARLDARLPSEIVELYRAFGGLDESPRFPMRYPMRLMPPDEVVETRELLLDQAEMLSPAPDARYFWTDDNSDWAGVFVTGPLVGKVCVLDHHEPDDVPLYRTVARFFEELVRAIVAGTDWFDANDYPSPRCLAPPLHDEDVAIVRALRDELARSEPEHRVRLGLHILQITPASQIAELMEFLDWESPWVQSTACRLMGLRDHPPAIPRLDAIARADASNNSVIAALLALGLMTDPRAREVLSALRDTIDPGFSIYFEPPPPAGQDDR